MGRIMINDVNFSGGGPDIDDNTTSASKVWSSDKTDSEIQAVASDLSGITLSSNPVSGDYHFELGSGWSVQNFVFNRVGNRIYLQGVFTKTSVFDSYETFISLSSSSTKTIAPYYETWFTVMVDNGGGANISAERLQVVANALRISSSNTNARRIFVAVSWISTSDEV